MSSKRKHCDIDTDENVKDAKDSLKIASADVEAKFIDVDAYKVAREHRSKLRKNGKYAESENLQYGEIDCTAFYKLLSSIDLPEMKCSDRIFVDIGSGSGKAVYVAASTGMFKKVKGIEIVEDLHKLALKAKTGEDDGVVEFMHKDCFDCVWQEPSTQTVLFLPITCFTDEMVQRVASKINREVESGSIIIATSTLRALDDSRLCGRSLEKLQSSQRTKYGKGTMEFTIYRKKNVKNE